jgi:hypothetical protein
VLSGVICQPLAAVATTEPPDPAAQGEVTPELPPPDIPTSNQQGYTFALKSTLRVDLDTLPKEARVYELLRQAPTKAEAQQIADRLKIGAEVQDKGNDTWEATGLGQVFIAPDVIQYFSLEDVREGKLPNDKEAIAFAREWLRLTGLLPPDLGEAEVVGRIEESQRLVVQFRPEEPKRIMSAYPSITVTMGPTGTILEASIRWAEIKRGDLYLLRQPKDAWNEVQSGEAYLEVELPEGVAQPGDDINGTATYSGVDIAYTTAGPPGSRQYLVPIFVFRGRMRPEGSKETYPIRAYVPALASSGAPVG